MTTGIKNQIGIRITIKRSARTIEVDNVLFLKIFTTLFCNGMKRYAKIRAAKTEVTTGRTTKNAKTPRPAIIAIIENFLASCSLNFIIEEKLTDI